MFIFISIIIIFLCIIEFIFLYTCPNGRLTENEFKRIFANFNLNLNPNSNRNTKAQKPFRENKITSFFGQVSRYH